MKTAKQEVLDLLETLPADLPMETLLERIRFKAKILRSLEQADRGEVAPHEEIMEDLNRWLESLGHPSLAETSKP
jgi:hypothetical protein